MSVLFEEIKGLLQQVSCVDGRKVTASLAFPKSFTGFKGHFPENPVVPGVCKVLAVIVILENVFGKKCLLKKIVQAKFMSFVTSDDVLSVDISMEDPGALPQKVNALFSSREKKIAQIQLEVQYV